MSLTEGTPLTAAMNYLWDGALSVADRRWLCQLAGQDGDLAENKWDEIQIAYRYAIMVSWTNVRRFVNENEGAFEKIKALRHGETA